MNLESLREHLAIKVMGWKLPKGDNFYTQGTGANFSTIHVDDWNPPENIEQATGCLDAIVTTKIGWSLCVNCSPQKYVCKVHRWSLNGTRKSILGVEVNHNKALASSIACANATGWKE